MIILLSSDNINIYGDIQNSNLLEILNLIPRTMIGEQYIEVLEQLTAFISDNKKITSYFNTSDFKRFRDNFLS
ncbi:TPA: hypothetical protein U1052_000918 [Streptococcus suis]|nr:hypothetical protein [Streptococcus suis]